MKCVCIHASRAVFSVVAAEMSSLDGGDQEYASDIARRSSGVGALEVVQGIHVFMKHLFPCTYCQKHFLAAYDEQRFGLDLVQSQINYRALQVGIMQQLSSFISLPLMCLMLSLLCVL